MNTAGRLLSIYDHLVGKGRANDMAMLKVWAEVFELPADSRHLEDDVVTCLQAMRSEMELLRTKLMALNAPEDLMHPGMARFRDVASTAHINAGWNGLREAISKPENRLAFLWANWALRDQDEEEMAAEDLNDLQSELDALEQSLQGTEMSNYLRDFVQRQVDAIRTALKVYRVQGVKPIENALQQVAGAYTIEKSKVQAEYATASEPAKGILSRVTGVIEKTAKVAENLDKIKRAGEGAWSLAAAVSPVLISYLKG